MAFSYQPANVSSSKASNSQGIQMLISYLAGQMGKGGSGGGDNSNPAGGAGPASATGGTSLAGMIGSLTGDSPSGLQAGQTPSGFTYDLPSTSTMGATGGKGLNSY